MQVESLACGQHCPFARLGRCHGSCYRRLFAFRLLNGCGRLVASLPRLELTGKFASQLELKISEEAIVSAHSESEGIADEVSRTQDLVDLFDALLLIIDNCFVCQGVCDELLTRLHAGLIQLPQLDPLLRLSLVEAPDNVGAERLHA